MRKLPLLLLASLALPAGIAVAQPPPPDAPHPAVSANPPAGSASAPVEIPPPPNVNDVMLNPVPPAPRQIASWEEALQFLRTRSTDLRTAMEEVRRAEGNTRIQLGQMLTQINGSVNATQNLITVPIQSTGALSGILGVAGGSSPVHNVANAAITAVQPLFNLANLDQVSIARLSETQSRLSVEDVKRTLALNVANAIVGVVTAERVAELNRVGFRNALERLDLTQRKRNLGAANGLDVIRVQQDVENARANIVTGDENLRQARETLGLALGIPEQVGVSRDVNIDGLERSALRVCATTDSIDKRADVAAARMKLDIAKRNLRNVDYTFLPTLNVQSTISTTSNPSADPATTWNIQAILSVPIWDGGQRYGNLRVARALQNEAEAALEALRRTAIIQIEQAHRGVVVAEQSRKVAADQRALSAEVDRLTQVSYREGQSTSLDLVVAAAALRQADINLALQEFSLVKARILSVLALATCPW